MEQKRVSMELPGDPLNAAASAAVGGEGGDKDRIVSNGIQRSLL